MRIQLSKIALAATLGIVLAFTFSCSSDDNTNQPPDMRIRKEKINGVSQKGPFINSTVTLYELDANMKKTGRAFTDVTDEIGNFEIPINTELASPFVFLEVKGTYRNEVDNGSESDGSITLKAIAYVKSKNIVNINALTHFEYQRVLDLVSQGKTFEDAKATAQRETFNKFGIGIQENFKNSEDMTLIDPALFTVSVILGIHASTTAELESLLEDVGKINSTAADSDIDWDIAEVLFNNAMDYMRFLYPNISLNINFERIKNTVEKIKNGGISDWDGGCETNMPVIYYCMEFRGITELACDMIKDFAPAGLSGMGDMYQLVKSCPKPANAKYCFKGGACNMIGCMTMPSAADCTRDGGQSTYNRSDCENNPKVETIFSCN
jgi:hypothetical protein